MLPTYPRPRVAHKPQGLPQNSWEGRHLLNLLAVCGELKVHGVSLCSIDAVSAVRGRPGFTCSGNDSRGRGGTLAVGGPEGGQRGKPVC